MASRTAARRSLSIRRPAANKKLERARESLAGIRRRSHQEAQRREREIISVGSAAVYGWLKGRQTQLPTIGNIEPALLYGAMLYVAPDMLSMGSTGKRVRASGAGLLTVAAYNAAKSGSLESVMGEEVGFDDFNTFDRT